MSPTVRQTLRHVLDAPNNVHPDAREEHTALLSRCHNDGAKKYDNQRTETLWAQIDVT